jgi:ubiquinone/menaquinone biosynthesis C-methylase UbiE/predicted MPP superfamily phosphohydrolase
LPEYLVINQMKLSGVTMKQVLHLSDLHFTNKSERFYFFDRGINTMVEKIAEALSSKQIRPAVIVASGDLTWDGDPADFELATRFFEQLLSVLDLSSKELLIVPGNHDMRWNRGAERADKNERDSAYRLFFKGLKGGNCSKDLSDYCITPEITILGLNSASRENPDNPGIGFVGEDQWKKLWEKVQAHESFDPTALRIAAIHHHLLPVSWVEVIEKDKQFSLTLDAEELQSNLISSGFTVVLHGHQHHPFLRLISSPTSSESHCLLVAGAGSASAGREKLGNVRRNHFQVLSWEDSELFVDWFGLRAVGDPFGFELSGTYRFRLAASGNKPLRIISHTPSNIADFVGSASNQLSDMIQASVQELHGDHPLIRFFGGWIEQLTRQLYQDSHAFEVDAHYYEGCLSAFQGTGSKSLAVADLSDLVETFWQNGVDPLQTGVTERVFLVPWDKMFNDMYLKRVHALFLNHSRYYNVRFMHVPLDLCMSTEIFGSRGRGNNLLLMEPDVVGGYVDTKHGPFLRIERSSVLFNKALHYYKQIKDRSLKFDANWGYQQIRSSWVSQNRFGEWNTSWNDVLYRSDDYFDNYDMHIRCWIPGYDEFNQFAADLVVVHVYQALRRTPRRLRVMEIGFGTGSLTKPILTWIKSLDGPVKQLGGHPIVERFLGVDRSPKMLAIASKRLRPLLSETAFLRTGSAVDGFPLEAKHNAPFDIICGSLVLHDLLEEDPSFEKITKILSRLSSILSPGGTLLFADIFFSRDPSERTRQMERWRGSMKQVGLTDDAIDNFLQYNQEMVVTLNFESLAAAASTTGFSPPELTRIPKLPSDLPFGILSLSKNCSA